MIRNAIVVAFVFASGCGEEPAAPAARIRFTALPTTIVAGDPFTVTVELLTSEGVRDVGATGDVVLSLKDPGTRVLAGETTVSAVDGLATFPALSIAQAGVGLQIVAGAGEFTASSAVFAVSAGTVSVAQSAVLPPPGNVPPNADVEFTFVFRDALQNPLSGAAVAVTSTLAGATFTPAAGVATETGEFTTVFRSNAAGSATVTATVNGDAITVGAPYAVVELCPGFLALAFPGSVDGVQPCGDYAPGVVAPSLYEFTTTGGGSAFTVTSTFQPLFQVKLNPTSADVLFTAEATPSTVEWLLPAGTYLFGVTTTGDEGTFTVAGQSVPANVGAVDRFLVTSGSYSGQTLDLNDSQIPDDGSFYDAFIFRSASACTITLRSSEFRPYLMVVDAITGLRVTNDVTTPIGVDAVKTLPVCRSGTANPIAIIANARDAGEVGAYTVILSVQGDGALRNGAGVTRATSVSIAPGRLREKLGSIVIGKRR